MWQNKVHKEKIHWIDSFSVVSLDFGCKTCFTLIYLQKTCECWKYSFKCGILYLFCIAPSRSQDTVYMFTVKGDIWVQLTWSFMCVSAEAGGAGQEGFKHEGAAAERAPLPQTPPGAAFCVRICWAHPHWQHGLHHLHWLRARYACFKEICMPYSEML